MALMKGFTLVFRLIVFLFIPRVTLRGAVSMPHTVYLLAGGWVGCYCCVVIGWWC
jgi:hypothetical protein